MCGKECIQGVCLNQTLVYVDGEFYQALCAKPDDDALVVDAENSENEGFIGFCQFLNDEVNCITN